MNWTEIAANWNRRCAVDSRSVPPVDPGHVFDVIRAVCEPFHRGMRHHSIPAVVFTADDARIAPPGDWLPLETDTDWDAYRARLSGRAANWRLHIVEPLFTDYPLWSGVRDLLTPLWERVGTPVLPVASALFAAAGDIALCETEPAHLSLTVMLAGRANLHEDGAVRELSPGDVAALPAAGPATLRADGHCLLLRLRVPVDRRLPTAEAVNLISRLVADEVAEAGEPVPELGFPPVLDGAELTAVYPPEAPEHPPHRAQLRAEAERLTRAWWAGRSSAAGLDPAPEPGEAPSLRPEQRIRLSAPVMVLPGDEPEQRLWAVNGMAFHVVGPVPGAVLDRLRADGTAEVAALCRDADGDDNGAAPLLDRLHELRAITIAEEKTS